MDTNSLYEKSDQDKEKGQVVKQSFYTERIKECKNNYSKFAKIKEMFKKLLP